MCVACGGLNAYGMSSIACQPCMDTARDPFTYLNSRCIDVRLVCLCPPCRDEPATCRSTAPRLSQSDTLRVFGKALLLLAKAAQQRKVMVEVGTAGCCWGYEVDVARRCGHVWSRDTVVVLHPIDPTCNIAKVR